MTRLHLGLVAFVGASLLAAITFIVLGGGFGAGDLFAFTLWTLIMSVPYLPVLALFARVSEPWRWPAAFLAAATLGLLLGVVLVLIVASLLGPWFLAFSFSPFHCWLAGGLAAFLLTAAQPRPEHRRAAVLFGVLFYLAAMAGMPVLSALLTALLA